MSISFMYMDKYIILILVLGLILILLLDLVLIVVSGVIVAVLGEEKSEAPGKFIVEDHCFQSLPGQVPRPKLSHDK